jgi:hypothetical protein
VSWDEVLRLQFMTSEASKQRFIRFGEQHHPELRSGLGV